MKGLAAPAPRHSDRRLETAITANFVYDGDGNRVKSVINGVTIYYVGNYYEKTGSTITKYYYAGSQRIAMRTGSSLYYLLSDHLGSTSLTLDSSGNVLSELRYKAWGEVRYAAGTTPTKYTYTGQYSNVGDFGLMFYNARWYDPSLGRFAQADTLCPITDYIGNSAACTVSFTDNLTLLMSYNEMNHEQNGIARTIQVPSMPQNLDRYVYGLNNPIKYSDPSGHCVDGASTELCLALLPAGPIGWLAIGVLVIVDVVLINAVVTEINTSSETALEVRGGSGGAASAAKHLAMLLGVSNVAGYPPHPGRPDPYGRDKNTNAKGLKADLENLQRNVDRSGKNLVEYLSEDQGWSNSEINDFIERLNQYITERLPSEARRGLVDPNMEKALQDIFRELMRGMRGIR